MKYCMMAAAAAVAAILSGCALERSDPAARSSRCTYGAITVTAGGEGSTAYITFAEGAGSALAAADGEGGVTQRTDQSAEQNPELTGGMDPVSAGITAAGKIGVAAIGAAGGSSGGDCKGGDCGEGACPGGDCGEGACPGGDCGE